MCWNAEVSLQSFLIGFTATLIAYQKGLSLPTILFCLTIVFMQLIEYVVWTWYENKEVNVAASMAAFTLLWLQPIASMMTLDTNLFLQAYLGITLLSFLFSRKDTAKYRMTRGENGHLVWHWLQKDWQTLISLVVYFFFLFTPLLLTGNLLLLTISLGTLGLSLYSFYKDNTWGSMWCWIVNYIVVGISGYQMLVAKP